MDRRSVLAGLLGAAAVSGCAPASSAGRTLVIGKAADISTVDPAVTAMPNDFAPIGLSYERLVRFVVRDGHPTGVLEGELARSWRLDSDGRSWEFELKPGHRFDDGSEVTAEAVRFSFERCLKIGLGVAQALDGLDRVEPRARYVARFVMRKPSPIFPLILALAPMSVLNPTVLRHEESGDLARAWLSENTAGSGPYRITSWLRGERMILGPNPHSATRRRYFNRVAIKMIKDEASYSTQLRKGDIDLYESITPETALRLATVPGVQIQEAPTPLKIALVPNNERKPLNDVRVRKALACAVDAAAIARHVFLGQADLMHGVLPRNVPGEDDGIPVIQRDLPKARKLLRDAGVAQLRLTLSYIAASSAIDTTAIALQSQLAEAGISVALEVLAPSAVSKIRSGHFDLAIGSWYADFPDPWPIMKFCYNSANIGEGLNIARYGNPAVDKLLDAAEVTMDRNKRIALYQTAQTVIVRDQPMIDLFSLRGLLACRKDVRGLNYNFWQPGLYNAAQMARLSETAA
jgi:peptide/nickel transport system substrate-binding protein